MQKVKILVAVPLLLGAAVLLFFHFSPRMPQVEARPHQAIGEKLAEEALRLAGSGGRITLIAPDTTVFRYPGAEVQLLAFRKALRAAKVTLAATNLLKLDPLRPPRVPPGDFAEILRKLSDADVVVSLMGPPVLAAEHKKRLGEKRPRVVAVCAGDLPLQVDLKELFADNLLHVAIVSRSGPGLSAPANGSAQDWFTHYYQLITAKNVSELSAAPASNAR